MSKIEQDKRGLGWNLKDGWNLWPILVEDVREHVCLCAVEGEDCPRHDLHEAGPKGDKHAGIMPVWNPQTLLAEVFGDRAKDARAECERWSSRAADRYEYRLNLAASIAVEWAWKKRRVSSIDVSAKKPAFVRAGVRNALRDADRMGVADDYDLWDQLPVGSDCPMCYGRGREGGTQCENCKGIGTLQGKPGTWVWTKVRRVTSIDPMPSRDDENEPEHTVLDNPDPRYINQPVAEPTMTTTIAGLLRKLLDKVKPGLGEAIEHYLVDGWSLRDIEREYHVKRDTLNRHIHDLQEAAELAQIVAAHTYGKDEAIPGIRPGVQLVINVATMVLLNARVPRKPLHARPADTGSGRGNPYRGTGGMLAGRIAQDPDDVLWRAKYAPDVPRYR